MAFNTAGARQAGYSDLEIAEFLGKENKFNTAAAIEAGYSPEEVIQYLVPRESTIGSELVRGAKQLGSSLQTGIGALFGSPEAAAQAGIERGQVIGEAAGEGPSFERARQAYETGGIGGAAKEVAGQIPRAIAGQLPQMAALATGARLGATAGAARGPVGAVVGGAMGAGATLFPSFFGSDIERQAAEQLKAGQPVSIDRGSAALAATGQVALEGAGTAFTLGKRVVKGVLGIADDVGLQTAAARTALEATAKRSLLATTAQGVARGLAVEIPVEIAQQVLERAQAGLDILSPDAFSEYGETAYQTGLAGGPFGAAGRIYERSGARGELAKEQADIQEAGAAERRARQAAQREAAAQQVSGIKGEKILDAEAAEQAKVAKAEEAAAQQTMKEDYAQRRAEREAELKEAFPADYSDVMERTNRYGVLATELASLTGVRKTPEVKGRIRTLQARMADVAAEDDRIPNEFLRMQRDQVAATRAAGFPAKKSAAVLGGAFPAQMEMREALAPVELPPQTDLFGQPLLPTTPQPEGLATVAEAELPLTSEVLRDAGIAPTTKELEAAGQQRLPLRKTPAGQPTSPVRLAAPAPAEVVQELPAVTPAPAEPTQPGAITATEVRQFGTMSKANRQWVVDNIEGRTPEQVRDMVEADPTIMASVPKGLQTVLKEIVATAAPKETPSVQPTPAPVPEVEPQLRARRGKPSMAISGEPAGAELLGAPAAEPTRAEELAPPVGLGLAPAGQPAGERAAPEVAGEPALDIEEAQRQAEAKAVIDALAEVRKAAQAPKAKAPAPAPAPAPKPAKAEPKAEAPAPAPTGSPFDVLERIKARKAAEALAEKPTPAKAEAAPAKAEAAPAKAEAPEITKAKKKVNERLDDLDLDPDTTKAKVRAVVKQAQAAGLIDERDAQEIERIGKDRDMGPEDMISELRSAIEVGPAEAPVKAEVPPPAKAALAGVPLTQAETAKLEQHYGVDTTSPEFWSKLQDDVANLTNKGIAAVNVAIRKIIQKIAQGVLAVGVVFNPNLVKTDFDFNLPQTYKTTVAKQIKAEVPVEAKAKMSTLAQSVYEAMAPTAIASGKYFMIADKPNGMMHVFKGDGSLLVQDAALYGKDKGDILGKISSLVGGPKITPAGLYTLAAAPDSGYVGGKVLYLLESKDYTGYVAVHAAYVGDPKEKRLQRLEQLRAGTAPASVSKSSFGCVNTAHDTFLKSILPNIEKLNGGMIFVLPDAQAATAAMFPATTGYTTFKGAEKTAKVQPIGELAAREAERPPEAPTVKPAVEVRTGLASTSEAVEPGQSIGSLRGEILRAKGALGSALRRAIASGKVVLETRHPDGGIGGYFDGEKVTLYAEGIPAGQAMAVALHEIGAHMGFKNLFGDRVYSNIIKQIQELATSKVDSADRTLAKAAMNRIPESDKARGVDVYGDETLAYFIEEAVKAQNAGTLATSGPVRALFNNIRLAMLAAINRVFGSKLGVADLTTRDILSMAEGAFIRESFSRVRKTAEAGKGRASTTAKAQPITDIITDMDREMPVEDTRPLLTRAADALREGIPKRVEGVSMIQRVANMAADTLDAGEPLMREIRKEVRASLPPTEANEALVALSYSQASHDGGVATAALDDGGIEYNDELAKFTTEKSGFNRKAVHDVYKRMAKTYGMTMPQARYATSTALESKRMLALYDTQADMLANAEVLKAAGSTAAATKMREKAESYIFHMTRAQAEKGMALFKAAPEISEIEQIKEGMRGWIRKHLQDTGVWSEETGQWMLDNAEWIPFNREAVEAAEGDVEAGGFNAYVRGLQVKAKEKAFKGSMREVHDVMDNFESWSDYSVRRGILNKKAADLATAALEYLPESEAVAVKTPMRNAADRTVSYLVNGEPQYVEFASAAKAQIFKGAPVMARSALPVIGGLVDSLNSVFRGAILNFPLFPIYQLAMDSISAVYLSGLSPKYAYKIPVLAVKEALATLRNASVAHERLRSVGATGVHDYNASLATANDDVTSRMKSLSGFEKYVALMHKMNLVADNAVRQGVYLAARDSGLSEAAAVEKAFEIINFRTRVGNNKLAAAARNVVFLNSFYAASRAALKVLSNEGISPTERAQAKKTLLSNLAWLGGISFVLALSNIGDDDYEKMSRQEQAGKLTLPGMHGWGIPLRPDVFMLVKVMAEMIARQGFSEFADDQAKVKATISDALGSALLSGPVPVAQPIKVAVELATNHSFFTGRPLVGRGLETQEAFRQFSTGTSELAKGIGASAKNLVELTGMKSEGISPVKIDHVIQGMLGMYGGALVLATNSMVNGRPTQSMQDTIASLPGMGRIGVKEFDSQIKSDFYDLAQTVHKAVDTANRYKAQGMREEYQEYTAEKKKVIKYGGAVQQIERQLSNIRKSISAVAENKNLTPEARDARILELRNTEKRMLTNLAPLIKKMRTEALS